MVIAPKVYVAPDRPVIRFKQPKEKIELDKEIQKVLRNQGWGLGTYFNVQFVNHDETELISQAEYVVSKDCEQFQTNDDNQFSPSSKTAHIREAILVGENNKDESEAKQAVVALIDGIEHLENEIVKVVEDGTERNEQIDGLKVRVTTLEEKRKPGPKPKPKEI